MSGELLEEELLAAWVGLSGLLKASRITSTMRYNEAVVMRLVYTRYRQDGVGRTPVSEIVRQTNMLKSLVNRTVGALCRQGYLCTERGAEDARTLFVRPVPERLPDFLAVHRRSLALARQIIALVGRQDAQCFVRMYHKIRAAGVRL